MFKFLGSQISALLGRDAARLAASRIEIRFEKLALDDEPEVAPEVWDDIVIGPAPAGLLRRDAPLVR